MMYSGDPKSDHLKTGNIRKPDIFEKWRHSKTGPKCPVFEWFWTKWRPKCPVFECHSKTGPFMNRSTLDHSKTGHVRFSDPHCSIHRVLLCYETIIWLTFLNLVLRLYIPTSSLLLLVLCLISYHDIPTTPNQIIVWIPVTRVKKNSSFLSDGGGEFLNIILVLIECYLILHKIVLNYRNSQLHGHY